MTTHHKPSTKAVSTCRLCKAEHPREKDEPPSGICSKCQGKIAAVILVIMVITTGMLFFGLI